jgi:hypothetical protein
MGFATAEFTIATAVTSPAGTVAIGYPTGTVQADFTGDNASATSYLLVNDNDRYTEAADQFDISFGASTITLTNKTTSTWAIGDKITLNAANASVLDPSDLITFGPIASIVDSSGGTGVDVVTATTGIVTVPIHLNLVALTTSAADLLSAYTPGYAFELLSVEFVFTTLATGAGASQILNFEIGTTNLTGGALTLLLADGDTLGKKKAATAITAANVGTAADTISLEVAAGGTVFTAGQGTLLLKLRNMDTVNAIKSITDKIDEILVGLRASGVLETA